MRTQKNSIGGLEMKKLVLCVLALLVVVGLTACGNKEEQKPVVEQKTEVNAPVNQEENKVDNQVAEPTSVPKSEQEGTAGSNIPLKDNHDAAEYEIKVAMQDLLKEAYGEKVFDARIYVDKIYTAEDEEAVPALKERNLGPNEVAFEVKYELKPAEGVDPIEFTAASGEYDEESGWVKEKYNLGILRPDAENEGKYKITDFGTGW